MMVARNPSSYTRITLRTNYILTHFRIFVKQRPTGDFAAEEVHKTLLVERI